MNFTLPKFNVGVAVEVKYTAPQNDRVQFVLMRDSENYMINIAARYNTKQLHVSIPKELEDMRASLPHVGRTVHCDVFIFTLVIGRAWKTKLAQQ